MAKRILVIDDEPDLVAVLKVRLETQGYEVDSAGDGFEGLKKVEQSSPDLIILDVLMPRMDGFTFILELKKNDKHKHIPVIVLTAKEMMSDLFKIEGVPDYIVKPFEVDELMAKVKKHV
jgi:DNA-binding response OmpR family regulator